MRRSYSANDAERDPVIDQRWRELEHRVTAFEDAWQHGERPRIQDYLSNDSLERTALLVELVHIDLEFRIKAGESPHVEDYGTHFPELLHDPDVALDLILAEFDWRRRSGQSPQVAEFAARFPHLAAKFPTLLNPQSQRSSATICPAGAARIPELPAGQSIGRFVLERRLGSGAFGTVYLARDTKLDRLVALKVLPAIGDSSARAIDRWLREARSMARLTHDGIVPLYDVGQSENTCYLVSEYVAGPTLAEWTQQRELDCRRAAELVRDVARALHEAHECGIIHRDVKPGNIIIDPHGNPRLTDFGLAKWLSADASQTIEGHLLGTPAYMSPEQAQGLSDQLGPASDVYSLGVVLYELLTGQVPFTGHSRAVLRQLLHDDPRPPRNKNPRVSRDLQTICLTAMAKQARRRYPTAAAMADDLQRYLAGQPIAARRTGWIEHGLATARKRPTATAMLLAAVLGAVGLAAGTMWHVASLKTALRDTELAREIAQTNSDLALDMQKLAEAREQRVREYLRVADLKLAYEAWQGADVAETLRLLDRHQDAPSGLFASRLLRRFCSGEQWTGAGHVGQIFCVKFSPDGNRLATGGQDGTLRLWATASGQPLGSAAAHPVDVNNVTFSPATNVLASCDDAGSVRLWDAHTLSSLGAPLDHPEPVYGLAFSPDGRYLATGGRNGRIVIWEVAASQSIHSWQAHSASVEALNYSPDGTRIASAGGDEWVRVWQVDTSQLAWEARHEFGPVLAVAFKADNQQLASGGQDALIHLWNASTGETNGVLKGHREQIQSLAFSPDGRKIASSSKDRTVRLWDLDQRTPQQTLRGHLGRVWQVAFAPDGQHLATAGSDGALKLWDATTTTPTSLVDSHGFQGIAFLPHEQLLVADRSQRKLQTYDYSLHPAATYWPAPESGTLSCIAPAADSGDHFVVAYESGIVEVRQRQEPSTVVASTQHAAAVIYLATNAATSCVAMADDYRRVCMWNPVSGGEIVQLGHMSFDIASLAVSPDASHVIAGGRDGSLVLWNIATREQMPLRSHAAGVNSCHFGPQGKLFVTGSDDRTWRLWNSENWQSSATFQGQFSNVVSLAITPCGATLAMGDADGRVILWDLVTRQQLFTLSVEGGAITQLHFSPQADALVALVTGPSSSRLVMWDARTNPSSEALPLQHPDAAP